MLDGQCGLDGSNRNQLEHLKIPQILAISYDHGKVKFD